MPRAAALCCPTRWKRRLAGGEEDEVKLPAPARPLAGHRPHWPFFIDLGVAACALALFFAVVSTGVYWFQKPVPVVPISSSIGALPLLRVLLHCAHGDRVLAQPGLRHRYGYIAAYNPRIEPWMVAVLDILQSIPVLSFLPPVVLAMVSLIPGHQLGIEMGVILLIFTGQVWNLAFSFYSSLKTIPREMLEASRIYRYSGWQRFWQLEMPFCGHWPGVELDCLGCGRLVCADLLRDFHHGRSATFSCRGWAATFRRPPTTATCARCWRALRR